uniref:Small ribosomal subunit protein mS39 n=1 Tax=Nomascus leucogenys TaxID=61853 RepID=A0A2I3GXM6_NOMLE
MAAVAAVHWLGLCSRLDQPLTGQPAGLCEQAHSCRFYSGSATLSNIEGTDTTGIEEVVIPKKKTWDKVAILQALASTVNRVPMAVSCAFQDNPYLIPTSSSESRSFLLAKKSGENTAKFIINSYSKYFQKNIAEPHILCLMPEYFEPQIKDISEATLKERIKLRKVKASVDMCDQLLQAGTTVSPGTIHSLLDLLCYCGDQELSADDHFQQTEQPEELEEENNERSRRKAGHQFGVTCAERMFSVMPEKNAHSYCTMIRGMLKHQAYEQALNLYSELLNNRLCADVYTFNAVIEATVLVINEKFEEKWNNILELLRQMVAQKMKPNLQTFNAILKCLRRFYVLARLPALQILREMKAIRIEPSLATYHHIIQLFYQPGSPSKGSSFIIYDIMTMRVSSSLRNLELAYQIHGHRTRLHVTLKWYEDLIPSAFFPYSQTREYGHTFCNNLREEILTLMAMDKHPPELQVAFAGCAADIKSIHTALNWPAISVLFLRAGRIQEAWKMLGLFRKHNKITRNELLNEFMDSARAIEVVELASAFLPMCEDLTQRVMTDFAINQEQKEALGNFTALTSDSDTDSSSDSDSDTSEDK